jgi:exopolysaccharide biosynthesis polyprenyl glycosylphosphotransferase
MSMTIAGPSAGVPLHSPVGHLLLGEQQLPRRVPVRSWALVLLADAGGLALPAVAVQPVRFALVALVFATLLAYQSAGLYKPRLHLSVLGDLPLLAQRGLLSTLLVTAVFSVWANSFRAGDFLVAASLAFTLALLARSVAYLLVRWARTTGRVGYRTVVLGGGRVAQQLAKVLDDDPSFGLRVVGLVDESPMRLGSADDNYLGALCQLPDLLRRQAIDVLIVAFGSHSEQDVVEVLRACQDSRSDVFIVPRLFEVHCLRGQGDHIRGIPMLRLRRPRHDSLARRTKRSFDLMASVTALLVLAPVLALIALAVQREGGPGVLFRQIRVGRDGREFELLKFRSLKPLGENESATKWSIAHDDRLGPVGRFLRRSSLDELPQFWNVLRGDMSIVGPRPERPHFVSQFGTEIPRYDHRHRVPSGLTGLAQVNGLRGDTSIADRARFDNYYIENWSLYLDVKILLLTIREVVFASGR